MIKTDRRDQRLDASVMEHCRSDFVRIFADQTVGSALAMVQRSRVDGRIVYFYVVNEQGHLLGVVPTRRLLLNPPEVPITKIMVTNVITVPSTATLLDACELFMLHRLLALPVVDAEKRIVGVIDVELYTDEITDLARREESDDVFQLIGVHLAQVRQAPLPTVFGKRFPWLLCNIGGGLACALVAGLYQATLDRVVVLALFIPVVLALAESVSIQSLTLTLQSQHGRVFSWLGTVTALWRELPVGVALGFASGGLVGLAALVWQGNAVVAFCILAAITLAVTTATAFGFAVPTVLRAIQRDPKVASGPIVLAMTDLCTLFYYLQLAHWLLG